MADSSKKLNDDIKYWKEVLNEGYENNPYYLPQELEDLRTFILRIHTEFEAHMEMLIKIVVMRPGKITKVQQKIFESIEFEKKIQIVNKIAPGFPFAQARRINKLRNELVHNKGPELVKKWDNPKKFAAVYEAIVDAYDALSEHGSYVAEDMPEWGYPDGIVGHE